MVRLAEVLSALTYALDLTEGQRPGHTLRTAALAMRLAGELGLDEETQACLYFAALLKDAGCSSNAARMASLFGSDDQLVKRNMRLVDWHAGWALAARTAANCGVGRNPLARLRHFLRIARTPQMTREIIQARCERGARIAGGLGFPAQTAEAIACVDEHWCGLGHPVGMSGVEIPLLSRILLLTQTLEAYWTERGLDAAMAMVRARRGRWFEPALADRVRSWHGDAAWWAQVADPAGIEALVVGLEPSGAPMLATDERLDAIAYAFAAVIDAKTPYTYRHSTNVARYAAAIAAATGAPAPATRRLLHAGLLHDIGKLGVSNRILDKPARLTDEERADVRKHPRWSWEILARVPAFRHFAASAACHHERLDGTGYPWGLPADDLDADARTLAIADVYEALTADRPYRAGLAPEAALAILRRDAGAAFDPALLDVTATLALDGTLAALAHDAGDPFAALRSRPDVLTPGVAALAPGARG
jgi:HD-GYP domain-containing protein (c-di-GMP phosphodiesterase class II)